MEEEQPTIDDVISGTPMTTEQLDKIGLKYHGDFADLRMYSMGEWNYLMAPETKPVAENGFAPKQPREIKYHTHMPRYQRK